MTDVTPGAEAIIPDEELELDLTPDGSETEAELAQKLANAERAKKQILARARKAELELKGLKEAQTVPAPKVEEAKPEILDDEVLDLRFAGHDKETIKFIMANGGSKALEDPNSLVSIAVKAKVEQRKAEEAASQTTVGQGAGDIERKFTPEQLKNMSLKELEALLPKADPS